MTTPFWILATMPMSMVQMPTMTLARYSYLKHIFEILAMNSSY